MATIKTITPLTESTLAGEKITKVDKLPDQLVLRTDNSKAVFGADGSRRMEKEGLFLEVKQGLVEYGLMRHIQFSFVKKEGGGLDNPDIAISPTSIRKLSGELGNAIKNANNDGRIFSAAEELLKKMKPGETYAEGLVTGKGFPKGEEPKIFIAVRDGKITQLGILGNPLFAFVPSKEGGIRTPAVLINSEGLKKLSDTEPGVVIGMVYKNIADHASRAEGFLKELNKLENHPEVREFFGEKPKFPRAAP